jgi:S-adenosylmethionine hydrolase
MDEAGLARGQLLEVRSKTARLRATYASTFGDTEPGAAVVYEDSARAIAVALNDGDAAAALGAAHEDEIELRR